jgi:hypothetical protein
LVEISSQERVGIKLDLISLTQRQRALLGHGEERGLCL